MGTKKAVVGFELSYEIVGKNRFCSPVCSPVTVVVPPFSVPYRLNFQPIDVPGGKVLHFASAALDLHSSGLRGQGQERQRIHAGLLLQPSQRSTVPGWNSEPNLRGKAIVGCVGIEVG